MSHAGPSDASTTSARGEHRREVAAVRARVHPDTAARRARDRARELEAAQAGRARAVQHDGVRRPPPARIVSPSTSTRASSPPSLTTSPSNPSSATSRFEPSPTVATARPRSSRPAQRADELLEALGARERPCRPARPERGEARERNVLLDVHASSAASSAAARSTSPGAERQDDVARPRPGATRSARRPRASASSRAASPAGPRGRLDDEPTRDPLDRLLPRRVDLRDGDGVRRAQRPAELEARGAACASRGAAGRARARAAARARGRRRSPRRPSPGCARSRRRHGRRRRRAARSGARRRGTRRALLRRPRARRRRARAPRARPRRCGGCARRASPARASAGSSSSPRTTFGTCASHSSKSASTSAREPNSVWWSRSTFVTTAISGRSAAIVRSDSSPSTTSQPEPARALPPS